MSGQSPADDQVDIHRLEGQSHSSSGHIQLTRKTGNEFKAVRVYQPGVRNVLHILSSKSSFQASPGAAVYDARAETDFFARRFQFVTVYSRPCMPLGSALLCESLLHASGCSGSVKGSWMLVIPGRRTTKAFEFGMLSPMLCTSHTSMYTLESRRIESRTGQ